MKSDKDILSSILKTTQMGQTGIRCVMDYADSESLQKALKISLDAYDDIEKQALALAEERDLHVSELAPVAKSMSSMMSKMKLQYGDTQSKIADMMILGNTRGIIKGIRNRHQWECDDEALNSLSQKLLDYESENISEMKKFL